MSMENLQKFAAEGPAQPQKERKIGERTPLNPAEMAKFNAERMETAERLQREFRKGYEYVEALKKLNEREMARAVDEVNQSLEEEIAALAEEAEKQAAKRKAA